MRSPRLWLTAAIAIVGANSLALSPIAAAIGADIGAPAADVVFAGALFGGGTAASALGLAPFADRLGLARALVAAVALLALSLLAMALATGATGLWLAQGLAGIASGVALPTTYGLASASAPEGQASRYMGQVLTGWTISMVFGASLAALVTDTLGWRWVYAGLACAGAGVVLGLVRARLPDPPAAPGASPLAALRVPGLGPALATCFLYMFAFYGLYAYLGTHLTLGLGTSTSVAGLAPLVYGIGFGASAVLDPLIDRHGLARMLPVGLSVLIVQYAALAALAFHPAGVMGLCLTWGLVNHFCLNMILGRLAGLDPARRAAILGLNSGVTYVALSVATWAHGLAFAGGGLAAMSLLSAAAIATALGLTVGQRP